jgi:hypothetical protein
MDTWKPVIGFEGFYEVTQNGELRSIKRQNSRNQRWMGGVAVKPITNNKGYLVVNLTKPGQRKQFTLHRIVLEAFVGICPIGYVGCHYDGNKENCSLKNLRWDTQKSNLSDAIRHGTLKCGEENNMSKLTDEIVIEIRTRKLTPTQAVREYGLSKSNAKRIVNMVTWKHLCAE